MILAIEPDFKFIKQCFDLVERVIILRALLKKKLCNLMKNITITVLIETFKSYYRSFLLYNLLTLCSCSNVIKLLSFLFFTSVTLKLFSLALRCLDVFLFMI